MNRLETVAPVVASQLRDLPSAERARLARLAVGLAVAAPGTANEDLRRILSALEVGRVSDDDGRWLFDHVTRLDAAAFDEAGAVETGRAEEGSYARAFAAARTAAALAFALAGDDAEAIYEASMAVDDPQPLWELLRNEIARFDARED